MRSVFLHHWPTISTSTWPLTFPVQRSGLHHLLMGVKHIPLEMQVNANWLLSTVCPGLLFTSCSTFTCSALRFLLGGGGQQLLGLWEKTLWRRRDSEMKPDINRGHTDLYSAQVNLIISVWLHLIRDQICSSLLHVDSLSALTSGPTDASCLSSFSSLCLILTSALLYLLRDPGLLLHRGGAVGGPWGPHGPRSASHTQSLEILLQHLVCVWCYASRR